MSRALPRALVITFTAVVVAWAAVALVILTMARERPPAKLTPSTERPVLLLVLVAASIDVMIAYLKAFQK